MRPHISKIRDLGADLVVVGNGTPAQAAGFAEGQKVDFLVFTDPTLAAYRNAGFKRSVGSTLGPRSILETLRAVLRGRRPAGRIQGDAFQQGGVLIVLPGGEVAWRFVSASPGDRPKPEEILARLDGALARG